MSKTLKKPHINPCERLSKHSKHCSSINGKTFTKTVIPKKILVSKKISKNFHDGKSCSAGVINKTEKHLVKPKKTTKSEVSFPRIKDYASDDYCKNCGDYLKHHNDDSSTNIINAANFHIPTLINSINSKIATNDRRKSIQQYYKNENFNYSTNSIIENNDHSKKIPLDTIKEDSETKFKTEDTIFEIYTESVSNNGLDLDKEDNVRQIKEFRQKNYFECHSTKSRLKTKGSVTSLKDHICVYRFYLNDRLFPVPLNTDYNGKVRCVECHLPMYAKIGDDDEKINGTIQAKVKLGNKIQDLTLLLPIKEPFVIKERRREEMPTKEVVYFGVIKLDKSGDSVFNRVLPGNSLALKYQKGYKEFDAKAMYRYNNVNDNDVVII